MSERMTDGRLADLEEGFGFEDVIPELVEALKAERAKVAELKGTLSNQECDTHFWKGRAEKAQAKVAELEAQAIDLKDEWADEAFECSEAEGNAKFYKAKVVELEAENKLVVNDMLLFMKQRDEYKATIKRIKPLPDKWKSHFMYECAYELEAALKPKEGE